MKGSPEKVVEWLEARAKTEKTLLTNGVKLLAKEGRTDIFNKIINSYGELFPELPQRQIDIHC